MVWNSKNICYSFIVNTQTCIVGRVFVFHVNYWPNAVPRFLRIFFIILKKWLLILFFGILVRVRVRFIWFLKDSCSCFLLSGLAVLPNCLQTSFFIFIELDKTSVIQGFDFVLSLLLDSFLRGKCLSNKLSILLKKSWNDRFWFPEGTWRALFPSIFSTSFSKVFGSKLWNDHFSFALPSWMPVSCHGTSKNWVRWSEIKVTIFPEMILLEALL